MKMAWSKCNIKAGKTGENDEMSSNLVELGVIKDKSASVTSEDGDTLEMKATGGETVGYEQQEGTVTGTFRVIEPEDSFFTTLGLGHVDTDDDGTLSVETHVVSEEYSFEITPKNVGAKGIAAPKCSVSVQTGWSEEDGNYADVTFGILHGQQKDAAGKGYWYKKFTKKATA